MYQLWSCYDDMSSIIIRRIAQYVRKLPLCHEKKIHHEKGNSINLFRNDKNENYWKHLFEKRTIYLLKYIHGEIFLAIYRISQ